MVDPADACVRLHAIRVTYPGTRAAALDLANLEIPPGQRVALVGRSGAGKSTLLRLINGQLRGFDGRASVLGTDLGAHAPGRALRRRIGFVFQEFALIERASVWDNVMAGRLGYANPWLSLLGVFTAADRAACRSALRQVGLDGLSDRRADRLSGGQKQRVGVARAMAQAPELLLADEPVSNLDPDSAREVLDLILDLAGRQGASVVMSLHQPELARRYADRIVALGQGRIVYDGEAVRFTESAERQAYRGLSEVAP